MANSIELDVALSRIHKSWYPLFTSEKDNLHQIFSDILTEKLCPNIRDIFSTYMLDANAVKVVIIGQDPYYTPNTAHGLCFSSFKIQPSLGNILKALNVQTSVGYLHSWLFQGVFLLNSALTTVEGRAEAHISQWKGFVSQTINYLSKTSKNKISYMLWGAKAQALETYICKENATILKWSHPSPMGDNSKPEHEKFRNCNHFKMVPEINWTAGLGLSKVYIYTDGALRNDAKQVASYGVIIKGIILNDLSIYGLVRPYQYKLINYSISTDKDYNIEPTAQRGEILAICYALLAYIKLGILHECTIYSDSRNTIMTLIEWYENKKRIESNDNIDAVISDMRRCKYENCDLLSIAYVLYNEVKSRLSFQHINGHQKVSEDKSEDENLHIRGNNEVDRLAKIGLTNDTHNTKRKGMTHIYLKL